MFSEKIIIAEHKKVEKLFPVITFVNGLSQHKALSAWLMFLSTCHRDISNKVRLTNILSSDDEVICNNLLNDHFDSYIRIECLSKKVQIRVTEMVFKIMKSLSEKPFFFLKDRFIKICGQHSYQTYWREYEKAANSENIIRYKDSLRGAIQEKNFIDFSIFFIALILTYGCGDELFDKIYFLVEKMGIKYNNSIPREQLGLCLWTLDFSFVEEVRDTDTLDTCKEHLALQSAVQLINPDVRIQVCSDSRLWSRDVVAWIDDDFNFFTLCTSEDIYDRIGSGLLNEGGNIITGTAKNKFILVAQSPLMDNFTELYFYQELDNLGIRAYTLPDGFLWARNPETKQDIALDSIHIDTVINCIPSWSTVDERLKIIIDPCYYATIKDNTEFERFIKEQNVSTSDIIIVDNKEQYLNLPNFSIILNHAGERSLLFNKDKGYTLPRLNLKAGIMVQPQIEIVNMSSFFGTIRCATNMIPESLIKSPCPTVVTIENKIPAETETMLLDICKKDLNIIHRLSKLWVKELKIRVSKNKDNWEFDQVSRTAYINILPDQASDPAECTVLINDSIQSLTENQTYLL